MTPRTTYRRFVTALTLPAYLFVSIACVCVTTAAAAEPAGHHAKAAHSCCPGEHEADKTGHDSRNDRHESCEHCSQAQSSETDALKVPVGALGLWMILPTIETRISAPILETLAAYSESAILTASPPSILRQKCTLLI